jgi:hypothetical protein
VSFDEVFENVLVIKLNHPLTSSCSLQMNQSLLDTLDRFLVA